jgi:ABC-type glycerol-3-phosphate transport system substrate-binding protein
VRQEELVRPELTRKSFLKIGGAGLAGALWLGASGCGGGSENSSGGAFTWWDYYQGTGDNAVNSMIQRYTKGHPGIKIKRQYVPFASFKQKLLQGATTGQLSPTLWS